MFLCFDDASLNLQKYIVTYGNHESVEVDDLSAERAYESVKNWLKGTDKEIYAAYSV